MKVAVITADIVNSQTLTIKQKQKVRQTIESAVVKKRKQKQTLSFFRGDSFQYITDDIESILRKAIEFRALIKTLNFKNKKTDIRISIGVGKLLQWETKSQQADGPALVHSGHGLDKISATKHRLRITTEDIELNKELEVQSIVIDTIIKDWSLRQATAVTHLLKGHNEVEIAKQMKTKQPSINRFKRSAKWEVVKIILIRFEEIIDR